MSVVQCKICGHHIELEAGRSLMECPACGCQVTLPVVTDEGHIAAFDRGNHFRRIGEFDKALAVFERIVREDEGNAEAHWCCALCRFGIEYVRDPATQEYLPTCHRASFDSFLEDVDYLAAVKYAADDARPRYQHDAEQIASVLRGVLATSQNEKPYDVFICYKERDAQGERTRDSQLAQDVYYQLTDHGLRVFFARITLEDKPGTQFEPYIFAALQSAKVMVVIGTKPEHLSAVWVRNEWSRYLALMKHDRSRLLIPCYRDMDPYDMPEQLSILHGYDMSKIGFIQDLVRGIRKVVGEEKPTAEPLLRRVALFLEDGDWKSADEYCERVLDIDPENARAYLGKLMAALHVTRQEKLRDQEQPFDQNPYYAKILRFADDTLAAELREVTAFINKRNEYSAMYTAYCKAEQTLKTANCERDFINAQRMFAALKGYKDSAARVKACEQARLNWLYEQAERAMFQAQTASDYDKAQRLFENLGAWRDAAEKAAACQRTSREIRDNEEAERQRREAASRKARQDAERRRKRNFGIGTAVIAFLTAVVMLLTQVIIPNGKYNDAVQLMEAGRYEEAIAAFEALNGYRDSETQIGACNTAIKDGKYDAAVSLMSAGKYEEAIKAFEALKGYRDSAAQIKACNIAIKDGKYDAAVALMRAGKYEEAIKAFEGLNGHKDSETQIKECRYQQASAFAASGNSASAAMLFGGLGDYKDAHERSMALWDGIRSPISTGNDHTVGLRADGTVVAVGENDDGECKVSGWHDIVAISAGSNHTVGLRADGTVVAVGYNKHGLCDVSEWRDIVTISAGGLHTIGLRADGTVVAVGYNSLGECKVSGWRDIVAISAGDYHTVGLRADGTVVAVGDKDDGQCDVSEWRDIVAISAGYDHTIGLRADGTVVAVGSNASGQCDVSEWRDIVAISAGNFHTIGLRADGTVVAVGYNIYGQCDVSGWRDIVAISAGYEHTVGLRADGTVVAVGGNFDGQCNVSTWRLKTIPRPTLPK